MPHCPTKFLEVVREVLEQETNISRSEENVGTGSRKRELLEENLLDDMIL